MGMVEYFPFFQMYNNFKYYEYVLYPDTKKNAWKKNKSHKLMGRNWAAFNGQRQKITVTPEALFHMEGNRFSVYNPDVWFHKNKALF